MHHFEFDSNIRTTTIHLLLAQHLPTIYHQNLISIKQNWDSPTWNFDFVLVFFIFCFICFVYVLVSFFFLLPHIYRNMCAYMYTQSAHQTNALLSEMFLFWFWTAWVIRLERYSLRCQGCSLMQYCLHTANLCIHGYIWCATMHDNNTYLAYMHTGLYYNHCFTANDERVCFLEQSPIVHELEAVAV